MSDIKNKISFLKKEKEKILSLDKKPEKQEAKKSQSIVVEKDDFFLKNKVEKEVTSIITDEEINNKTNYFSAHDSIMCFLIGIVSISIPSFMKMLAKDLSPINSNSNLSDKINIISNTANNMMDFLLYPMTILGVFFIIKGFYIMLKMGLQSPR